MGTRASSGDTSSVSVETDSSSTSSTADNEMRIWTLGKNVMTTRLCRLLLMLIFHCCTICSSAVLIFLLAFWFYGGVVPLILLHIAVLGILYNAQDLILYYPEQPPTARLFVESPSSFGLSYETVYIRSHDGTLLHAQLVSQPSHSIAMVPTLVMFHGNAGNIGHRLPNVQSLCFYAGVNVLLVEYRGYGRSQGQPSEHGIYMDARAALDYLFARSDVCQQKIIVFGRSLGGAVALRVSSESYYASRLAAVIVENTFTSIPDMARSLFDFRVLSYLPDWCFKNKYPSRCLVHKITIPSLFICGLQDNLVPPRMMHQLYELSGSCLKRMATFPDGTHNETWQCHKYYDTINLFLSELDKSQKGAFVSPNSSYRTDVPFDETASAEYL